MPPWKKGVRRFDAGAVSNVEITPQGFLRCDGSITRTGVFTYRNADGSLRRELRLPEEVFKRDAVDSFALAPLTNNHPGEGLNPTNTGKFQVGSIVNPRRDENRVIARVQITDAKAIKDVQDGKTQLSCGYDVDLEPTGGITMGLEGIADGQRFDVIQRNISGNHVAIVDSGRAGSGIGLRLDHDDAIQVLDQDPKKGGEKAHHDATKLGDFLRSEMEKKGLTQADLAKAAGIDDSTVGQIIRGEIGIPPERRLRGFAQVLGVSLERLMGLTPRKDQIMETITIDGITFEVSPQVAQAVNRLTGRQDELNAKVAELGETVQTEKARADKAEEDLAAEKKAREDAVAPEKVREAIDARLQLERQATPIIGEMIKIDGADKPIAKLADDEIRREVVIKISKDPKATAAKLDGCEAAYLTARFDAAVDSFVAEPEKNAGLAGIRVATAHIDRDANAPTVEKARQDMVDRNLALGREPVGGKQATN